MSPWKQGACQNALFSVFLFVSTGCAVLQPRKKKVDSTYVFYFIRVVILFLEGAWINKQTVGYGHQLLSHSDTFDLVFATWP